MPITKASNRFWNITANDNGNILELGPASTENFTAVMVIQFQPDAAFNGVVQIMARMAGPAAGAAQLPFIPVPYRRVTINNVAWDYAFTTDQLTLSNATKILVPSFYDSIGLLVACTTGNCSVVCQDLQGTATP